MAVAITRESLVSHVLTQLQLFLLVNGGGVNVLFLLKQVFSDNLLRCWDADVCGGRIGVIDLLHVHILIVKMS